LQDLAVTVLCAKVAAVTDAAGALFLQAGGELSLADVSVLCAVSPLLGGVLSAEARQPYPALLAWQQACSSNSHISTVLGEQQQQEELVGRSINAGGSADSRQGASPAACRHCALDVFQIAS
jgi:hypothetical protein